MVDERDALVRLRSVDQPAYGDTPEEALLRVVRADDL